MEMFLYSWILLKLYFDTCATLEEHTNVAEVNLYKKGTNRLREVLKFEGGLGDKSKNLVIGEQIALEI